MSIKSRQRRQLRRINADLRRSDPHLGAMLGMFGRLYQDEIMPAAEQQSPVPASQSRLRRAIGGRRARAQASAARRERTRSGWEADTQP